MTEAQKRQLESALWGIANDFRGTMDAVQFRYYVLGFIFYRCLSERLEQYADRVPMFSPWRIEGHVRLSRIAINPA